jgi:hypothetical protein
MGNRKFDDSSFYVDYSGSGNQNKSRQSHLGSVVSKMIPYGEEQDPNQTRKSKRGAKLA